jgi:hypothetical protein
MPALMNPVVAYAKIATSFQDLYRRRGSKRRYTITIASAMSALLLVNIWSLLLLVSVVDHGRLASRPRIGPVEYASLCALLVVAEFILVDRVFSKIDRDKAFAEQVAAASPHISKWYIASSVILLGVVTIVRLAVK